MAAFGQLLRSSIHASTLRFIAAAEDGVAHTHRQGLRSGIVFASGLRARTRPHPVSS